ncbi:DUF551 domain-containing protein [Enterobacter ludwigii]|uniref:DUF551 domain-containing protein n=1 Tax=Enterobacter ludwigii TaxID=299767 RepID=UPI002FD73DD8
MSTITKEWLQQTIADMEAARDEIPFGLDEDDSNTLAALRIALASLEAEAVAWLLSGGGAKNHVSFDSGNAYADPLREVTPLYTAPPAPVSVPDAYVRDERGRMMLNGRQEPRIGYGAGWNACRAAMLQGADRPQNEPQNIPENIPATQFKPVADLYGLTSPTGGETSFTFDAVEARDFIDGGWSCQEYVELERFQEAITNHTEDKLAMVDHSGDSNNMAEPVTTACKLPANTPCKDAPEHIWLQTAGVWPESGEFSELTWCSDNQHPDDTLYVRADVFAGNSPVITDGWVACSERMPEDDDFVYIWPRPDFGVELHVGQYCECHPKGDGWYAQVYEQNYGIEWCPITVTHWMPLPAAPQQEVK